MFLYYDGTRKVFIILSNGFKPYLHDRITMIWKKTDFYNMISLSNRTLSVKLKNGLKFITFYKNDTIIK